MKLSTALRRAAKASLKRDGLWHLSAGEEMCDPISLFCASCGMDSSRITKIAEGEGR